MASRIVTVNGEEFGPARHARQLAGGISEYAMSKLIRRGRIRTVETEDHVLKIHIGDSKAIAASTKRPKS